MSKEGQTIMARELEIPAVSPEVAGNNTATTMREMLGGQLKPGGPLLPLFLGNFRGGPNPVPATAALVLMGLLDTDAVRAPLLPLDPDARAAMAVTLRSLGLTEAAGGRISTRVAATREAVA